MDKRIAELINGWGKRNIEGIYCPDKNAAVEKILKMIPLDSSVGFSGSVTIGQIGIIGQLEGRGNKVFDPYKEGISRQESLELRRRGAAADYYLASANAVSQGGELVFFSAYGNRTAGVSYAKNVIIVCSINKITPNLEEALKRAREQATLLNCRRLDWKETPCFSDGVCRQEICFAPEYKRMCCQVLIIESEAVPGRMKVIIAAENLGF